MAQMLLRPPLEKAMGVMPFHGWKGLTTRRGGDSLRHMGSHLRWTNRFLRSIGLVAFLAILCTPWFLSAQDLFRPPPPETRNKFSVSFGVMSPVTVKFGQLGTVPFLPLYDSSGDLANSSGRVYNTGAVLKDSSYLASATSDGLTTYWNYSDPNAVSSGRYLKMTQYASVSEGSSAQGDSSLAQGWEIKYSRYLGYTLHWGLECSFAFNQFTVSTGGNFKSTLLSRTETYDFAGRPIPGLSSSLLTYQGPSTRPGVSSTDPISPTFYAPIDPLPGGPTDLPAVAGGATGTGLWELRASLYRFRVGPFYNFDLGKRKQVNMQFGAGFQAIFYNGDYLASESIQGPLGNATAYFKQSQNDDLFYGGYAEASASYMVTPRVGFFSGLLYQNGTSENGTNNDRTVEVDLSSSYEIKAGIGIKF